MPQRYWELKETKAPTTTTHLLKKAEAVLRDRGVIIFSEPTPGARLATSDRVKLPLRG
jgi:hypothetical protein